MIGPSIVTSRNRSRAECDECAICLELAGCTGRKVVTPCGHSFCEPCIVRHVDSRREAGAQVPDCPTCRHVLSPSECRMLGARRHPTPVAPCNARGSGSAARGSGQSQEVRALRQLELRRCPACSAAIQKSGGCSQMRCRCGHRFVWTSAPLISFEPSADGGIRWNLSARPAPPVVSSRLTAQNASFDGINGRAAVFGTVHVVGGIAAGGGVVILLPPLAMALVAAAAAPGGERTKWFALGAFGGAAGLLLAGGPFILGLIKAGAALGGLGGALAALQRWEIRRRPGLLHGPRLVGLR